MSVSAAHLLSRAVAARWRPGLFGGLPDSGRHEEVFASSREASGAGLALALARDALLHAPLGEVAEAEDRRCVLWVQDRAAIRLSGRPYRPGLPGWLQGRLLHVAADKPEDALFALEEGLRCRDLACVIGEMVGNPRVLDFTASRRLTLAAEKHGVPLWLVRLDAARDLSSARMRWEVAAAPSAAPPWNARAPGRPAWRATLFRARNHPPGEWTLDDHEQSLTVRRSQPDTAPKSGPKSGTPYPVGLAFAAGARSLAAS